MLQGHAEEYRQKAEECRLHALEARTVHDRANWLGMAEEWIRLADGAEAEHAAAERQSHAGPEAAGMFRGRPRNR
jgi:hypothetical protein